jgi:hypothetical protein
MNTTQKHVVNLAVLQNFFRNSSYNDIRADTLLDETPRVLLPKLGGYTHELEHEFTAVKQDQQDLRKVAQALKNGKTIVTGLDQAIATENWQKMFSRWPGIVMAIVTVIVGLLTVIVPGLMMKITRLSAALVAVQQIVGAEAQVNLEFDKENVESVSQIKVANGTNLGEIIIAISAKTGPLAVVILVLVTIMIFFLYKVGRAYCKKILTMTKSTLAVELVSNQTNLIVRLVKFRGLPADYIIRFDDRVIKTV